MSIGYTGRTRLLGSGASAQVSQWLNRSVIKSIQSGLVTMSGVATNTATITAVATNAALLIYLGSKFDNDADSDASRYDAHIQLTNGTTVTGTRTSNIATCVASFMVVEFLPGVIKSIQAGTIATGAGASNTATVTAINVNKAILSYLGALTTDVLGYGSRNTGTMVLTNATTITFTRGTAADALTGAYRLVEFF